MEWTASETDLAVRYWREGFSASQIAKLLPNKRSRNAIIGKIHRKIGARRTPNTAYQDRKRARAADSKINLNKIKGARLARRPERKRAEPVAPLNIPFLETGFGQCRAVTDATRFEQRCCGHPASGVYCDAHSALFYAPNTKAERVR